MANVWYRLVLLASLAVWQSGADEACDSVECVPTAEEVCALDEDTGSAALFANECVLRCTNCRMATEFKKVNRSLCSTDARYITVCADFALNEDNEEVKIEVPDNGIAVEQVDIGPGGYDEVPPFPGDSPPLLPLLSVGSELLSRLVKSSQPEPPPEGLTFIRADIKVDVNINILPPPPPPPLMLSLPRLPLLAPPPPPPAPPAPPAPADTPELRLQSEESDAYSAASPTPLPTAAVAVVSIVAVVVAAVHI